MAAIRDSDLGTATVGLRTHPFWFPSREGNANLEFRVWILE